MKKLKLTFIAFFWCSLLHAQWFDWEARLGLSPSDLPNMTKELEAKGFTPITIQAHFNEVTSIATIWKRYPEKAPWEIRTGLNPSGLQEATDFNKARGYIPIDVSVYSKNGELQYAGIWSKDESTQWESWTGINANDFKAKIDNFSTKGFRLVDIDGYIENDQKYYSGIWKRFSNLPWKYIFGYNETSFKQNLKDITTEGYIPTKLNVFTENGVPLFSAVYVKIANEKAKVLYNIKESEIQKIIDNNVNDGYSITDISSYFINNLTHYALVFSKAVEVNADRLPVSVTTYSTVANSTSISNSKLLSINPVEQQTNVWCWLAVGEMIFRHFGISNANPVGNYQCGIIGSLNFVNPYCRNNCFNNNCIVPSGSNYNTVRMLRDYAWTQGGKIFKCSEAKELSLEMIKRNIDRNSPVLAGISYNSRVYYGGSEHVVLITGYEIGSNENYFIVNDPFPYPNNMNPFLKEGGVKLKNNQYKISIRNFTEGVFWNWSIYNEAV